MNIDSVLAALADPTRRELLARLARRPSRAGALALGLPMSRPAVAKHMSVLRRARLVESRRSGREQIYSLRPQGRAAIEELQRNPRPREPLLGHRARVIQELRGVVITRRADKENRDETLMVQFAQSAEGAPRARRARHTVPDRTGRSVQRTESQAHLPRAQSYWTRADARR